MSNCLRYFKRYHGEEARKEITYDEALNTLLTTWKDNEMTRDMLSIPNNIQCRFSTVYVEDHSGKMPMVLMAGLYNILPDGVEYDNNGNRFAD